MTSPDREDAEELKEWDKPARSPTVSCLFLTLVPLGLLLMALYQIADMAWRGSWDDWDAVIAPLVVLMGFPIVGLVVLRVNQKMFRQASEELERMAQEQDAPSDPGD